MVNEFVHFSVVVVVAGATTTTSGEEDEEGETDFASAMGNRSHSVIGAYCFKILLQSLNSRTILY